MADYYISVNKYDLAEKELKKCLNYNKSHIKAEELFGLIKEKEKAGATVELKHVRSHTGKRDRQSIGNAAADRLAKWAALRMNEDDNIRQATMSLTGELK